MLLNIDDVLRVAREAIRREAVPVSVAGVTTSPEGSRYAEVVLQLNGVSEERRRFAVGIFRDSSEDAVMESIARTLRRYSTTTTTTTPHI
jgi:hypothetical protein